MRDEDAKVMASGDESSHRARGLSEMALAKACVITNHQKCKSNTCSSIN